MSIAKNAVEELYERTSELAPADRAELAGLLLESHWAYPGFVDGLVVGSGGASRLTLFELHG